jgi:dihydropyrimidine dehydrogenase (NAD+) subunit PreT
VFLGLGLGRRLALDVPRARTEGVYGAVELIERHQERPGLSLSTASSHALVIGGGNTAIDIVHELALLGVQEVSMVYRRSEAEHALGYAARNRVRRMKHGVRVASSGC